MRVSLRGGCNFAVAWTAPPQSRLERSAQIAFELLGLAADSGGARNSADGDVQGVGGGGGPSDSLCEETQDRAARCLWSRLFEVVYASDAEPDAAFAALDRDGDGKASLEDAAAVLHEARSVKGRAGRRFRSRDERLRALLVSAILPGR